MLPVHSMLDSAFLPAAPRTLKGCGYRGLVMSHARIFTTHIWEDKVIDFFERPNALKFLVRI
jgi:hypothetical protein